MRKVRSEMLKICTPAVLFDPIDDLVGMAAVAGLDRDVAEHALPAHLDQIHRANVPAAFPMTELTRSSMPGLFRIASRTVEAVGGARG